MTDQEPELKRLYAQAKAALEAMDWTLARDLLKRIVSADENYEDASRLLVGLVERQRRRWYGNPRVWIGTGALILLSLLAFLASGGWNVVPGGPVPGSATQRAMSPDETMGYTSEKPPGASGEGNEPDSPPAAGSPVWKRIYTGQDFARDTLTALAIDPRDPDVILVGGASEGVYRSIDGGLSWQPAFPSLGQGGITSLAISEQDSEVIFAGVSSGGLYRTQDGGATWQGILEGGEAPNLVVMDPQDSLHLYFASLDLFETANGGEMWEVASRGDITRLRIGDMVVDPKNGETLVASGTVYLTEAGVRGIFRSMDGGRTWQQDEYTGGGADALAWDAEGVLALGDGGWIYRRLDGGAWDPVMQVAGDATDLVVATGDPRRKYLLGVGLQVSEDSGATWAARTNGLGGTRLDLYTHPTSPSVFFAEESSTLFGQCGLYRSPDRGATWERLSGAESAGCTLAMDAGGEIVYRSLGRSEDGGLTWSPLTLPGQGRYIAAHPAIPGNAYSVLWDNPLAISSDFGVTWEVIGKMRNDIEARLLFGEGSHLYAFGYPRGQRSNDLGYTWEDCGYFEGQVLPSRAASRALIDPRDSDKILVATRGSGLQESNDGCLSWQARNEGIGSMLANTLARDPNHPDVLYAGTDGGAFVSLDGGEKWIEINAGLLGATVIYSIIVDPLSNVYAATPYGIFKLEAN